MLQGALRYVRFDPVNPVGLINPVVPNRVINPVDSDDSDDPVDPVDPPPTLKGTLWKFDVKPTIWPKGLHWSMKNQARNKVKLTLGLVCKHVTLSTREALDDTIRALMRGYGSNQTKESKSESERAKRFRLKQKKKCSRYPPLSGRGCAFGLFVGC